MSYRHLEPVARYEQLRIALEPAKKGGGGYRRDDFLVYFWCFLFIFDSWAKYVFPIHEVCHVRLHLICPLPVFFSTIGCLLSDHLRSRFSRFWDVAFFFPYANNHFPCSAIGLLPLFPLLFPLFLHCSFRYSLSIFSHLLKSIMPVSRFF